MGRTLGHERAAHQHDAGAGLSGAYFFGARPAAAGSWSASRMPALIVSPFAKKGFVDKTQYNTACILRFVTHRWSLPPLPRLVECDTALLKNGGTRWAT